MNASVTTGAASTPAVSLKRALGGGMLALGVVYGDIGTSPLYALRECLHGAHAVGPSRANVLGVVSLIVWSLVIVISVKYLAVVLRADNKGEGGILALMALVGTRTERDRSGISAFFVFLGLFGAALLYGDGVITPAISVLSAVEGVQLYAPSLGPAVVPITIAILVGMFLLQHRGTKTVGVLFGPVTLIWFVTLAVLGLSNLVETPAVLWALSPHHAAHFLWSSGWDGARVLGSVFLVVTGGEALYADMGHMGARPIRQTWFVVVLPALLLSYLGQGALLLRHPELAGNPFFQQAPGWALLPLLALATLAAIIASQAVVTGAFSVTWQAMQLGYLPRMEVRHTSADERGQIYIPAINHALLVMTVLLVLVFQTSSALAAAYGVAVTATMAITTVLLMRVMRRRWQWSRTATVATVLVFLVVDIAFFGANVLKLFDGGWVPLAMGIVVFTVMTTWRTGRRILADRLTEKTVPLAELSSLLAAEQPLRSRGTSIFLSAGGDWAPPALVGLVRQLGTLSERVVVFCAHAEEVPWVAPDKQLEVEELGEGIVRITARCGFMQRPHVPSLLQACVKRGTPLQLDDATYVLGRENLLATKRPGMALWREKLFAAMSRNAGRAAEHFGIPAAQVIEVGAQIEL